MLKFFAQRISASLLHRFRGTRWDRCIFFLLRCLRKILLKCGDPLVSYRIGKFTLFLPFSHDLPLVARAHPRYNTNLARIARYVNEKYADLTIIDIGANIGDSAAFIRNETVAPILCLEGNRLFFDILQTNITSLPNVSTECIYVGAETGVIHAGIETHSGTSRLTLDGTRETPVSIKALNDIVKRWPRFQQSKLIKIDTDGLDIPIIRGSIGFLAASKPVLFFEYDPAFFAPLSQDGLSIFKNLHQIGYTFALVYDNLGDLMITTYIDDERLLEDIHEYFVGWQSGRYCDICLFAGEDLDLAQKIRASEQLFCKENRKNQL